MNDKERALKYAKMQNFKSKEEAFLSGCEWQAIQDHKTIIKIDRQNAMMAACLMQIEPDDWLYEEVQELFRQIKAMGRAN